MTLLAKSEIWRFRELLYFLVWRDVKIRYKQTFLGAAWAILQPFITMIVFSVFFGRLAKIPTDGIPHPIFWYSALLPWTYFSGALTAAGNSLLVNRDLITKVYFPRLILPASSVLTGLVDFMVATGLLVALMAWYRIELSWGLLVWPLAVVVLVFLALGAGMFLAALNVNYRDVKYALPFAVQLLLFLTPIIYPSSMVPERWRWLLAINPLTGIIEACRASLLSTHAIDWTLFGVSVVVTLVVFVLGFVYFERTQRSFADII